MSPIFKVKENNTKQRRRGDFAFDFRLLSDLPWCPPEIWNKDRKKLVNCLYKSLSNFKICMTAPIVCYFQFLTMYPIWCRAPLKYFIQYTLYILYNIVLYITTLNLRNLLRSSSTQSCKIIAWQPIDGMHHQFLRKLVEDPSFRHMEIPSKN